MNAATPIANQAPVVERVQDALRATPTSAHLEALHAEASDLLRGMQDAEADCRTQSLSPSNSVAEARAARQSADDFAHEGRRLEAALASLDEALPIRKAAEHQAAIMPAYEAFKAERAAAVDAIRENWPKLEAAMVQMLDLIERFDTNPGVEIPEGCDPLRLSIEAEARGCDGSFYAAPYPGAGVQQIARLTSTRLPAFKPSSAEDQRLAWPRNRRSFA